MRISRLSGLGAATNIGASCSSGWVGKYPDCTCVNPPMCAADINARYAGRTLTDDERKLWIDQCHQVNYNWSFDQGCVPNTSFTKILPWALGGFAVLMFTGFYLQYMRIKKGLPEPGTQPVTLQF